MSDDISFDMLQAGKKVRVLDTVQFCEHPREPGISLGDVIPVLDYPVKGQVSTQPLKALRSLSTIPWETMEEPFGFIVLEKRPDRDWNVTQKTAYLNDVRVKDANGALVAPTTLVLIRGPRGSTGKDGKTVYVIPNADGTYTKVEPPEVTPQGRTG